MRLLHKLASELLEYCSHYERMSKLRLSVFYFSRLALPSATVMCLLVRVDETLWGTDMENLTLCVRAHFC